MSAASVFRAACWTNALRFGTLFFNAPWLHRDVIPCTSDQSVRAAKRKALSPVFKTLMRTLQSVSGIPAPTRRIPPAVLLLVAYLSEAWAKVTGGSTVLSVLGVRTMQAKHRVSAEKSIRELGATYRPLEATLADTVVWMRRWHGLEAPATEGLVVPRQA